MKTNKKDVQAEIRRQAQRLFDEVVNVVKQKGSTRNNLVQYNIYVLMGLKMSAHIMNKRQLSDFIGDLISKLVKMD